MECCETWILDRLLILQCMLMFDNVVLIVKGVIIFASMLENSNSSEFLVCFTTHYSRKFVMKYSRL